MIQSKKNGSLQMPEQKAAWFIKEELCKETKDAFINKQERNLSNKRKLNNVNHKKQEIL